MKVMIRDRDALLSIRPLDVVAYLRTHGWIEARDSPIKGIWLLRRDRKEFEILTPLDHRFVDYPNRVSDMLRTLEIVEGRSQLQILTDITSTSFDIIRVRPDRGDMANGFLPIEEGVALVGRARDMITAAACSEVSPRPVQAKNKPERVKEYIKKVNLGQTERGSYVITILSPVPPELSQGQIPLPDLQEDPFERKVTKRLMRSVFALCEAAERSMSEGSLAPFFEQAVARGVSADLCDAIVGLQQGTNARAISIETSWSPVRPMEDPELRMPISISGDATSVIEQAAGAFRTREPIEDSEIEGIVIHLDQAKTPESAIVRAVVDGVPLKVKLPLEEKSRQVAITAYERRSTITCTGDLVKEGLQYTLREPRHFRIVDANEDDDGGGGPEDR